MRVGITIGVTCVSQSSLIYHDASRSDLARHTMLVHICAQLVVTVLRLSLGLGVSHDMCRTRQTLISAHHWTSQHIAGHHSISLDD